MDEVVLAGGNLNAVTRLGETVLRRAGPWSPTVHRLLVHLGAGGVRGIPAPLGVAPDGRERLTCIEGDVPLHPMPQWVWGEQVLLDAGRLLRHLHDASLDFDLAGAVWQLPAHEPAEVICHNDFSPHNLVFQKGRLVGAIDFDVCSPGPRVWDLAYLATRLVPLTEGGGDGTRTWADLIARTAALLDAYGSSMPVEEVLEVAHLRLLDLAEHATHYRREAAWLRAQPSRIGSSSPTRGVRDA